jgi:hypothetical protein
MALIVKDRIKETTTTTGTGTVTLAGAEAGFQAFSVVGDANTTYYAIVSGNNWEVGLGTYTLSGTTLSRDTILESSNSGSAITLAGTSDVFCTYPAEKSVLTDAIGTAAALDTGISNTNVPKFTSGVADDDFLRVDGTAIEGRSASEVLSDIGGVGLANYSTFVNSTEKVTVSATAATGTINYDTDTQSVVYYTSAASGDWTINFRASSGASLDSVLAVGEAITLVHLVTLTGAEYRNTVVQVDGVGITPEWQGGAAPTEGNINSIDSYSYTIIKTGSAAFTILAALTQFA